MELKVVNEREDKVFGRRIVNGEVTFEGTVPSRGKVLELAAGKLKAKHNTIVIRSINTAYGGGKAKVEIAVYDDASKIAEVELGHIVKRTEKTKGKTGAEDAKEEAAKETAAPKEESASEEPAEQEPKADAKESDDSKESEEEPSDEKKE